MKPLKEVLHDEIQIWTVANMVISYVMDRNGNML